MLMAIYALGIVVAESKGDRQGQRKGSQKNKEKIREMKNWRIKRVIQSYPPLALFSWKVIVDLTRLLSLFSFTSCQLLGTIDQSVK